ncbi:MAG: methyltransferase [Candidatus Eisenbacteria bacterium]
MLHIPTRETATTLRRSLIAYGYDEPRVQTLAGNLDPPIPGTPRWYRLEDGLDPSRPEDAVVLWFFLGAAIRADVCSAVSPEFVAAAVASGLLVSAEGWGVPQCLLVPGFGTWFASDRFRAPEETPPYGSTRADGGPPLPPDPVLAVGPTPMNLDLLSLRTEVESVLDLCAGGGILAIRQAAHADQVTATDLSARAVAFARFNVALEAARRDVRSEASDGTGEAHAEGGKAAASRGGPASIELLEGDLFAPVAGRRFDRIVCNPPFILVPSGPVGLTAGGQPDAGSIGSICERIARAAPDHLTDGGTFQMIFEWPEMRGERWTERLAGWVEGSGCDAWFVRANQQSPDAYVETRVREMDPLGATDSLGTRFRHWMAFLRANDVEAIHGGFLLLRRRSGGTRRWIHFDELGGDLVGPASVDIERGIRRLDHLAGSQDGTVLGGIGSAALRRAETLREFPVRQDGAGFIRLEAGEGWVRKVTVQPEIAEFLRRFESPRTADDALSEFAAELGRPEEEIRAQAGPVIRGLYERGFLDHV